MSTYHLKLTEENRDKLKDLSSDSGGFAPDVIGRLESDPMSYAIPTFKPALSAYYSRVGQNYVVLFDIDHDKQLIEVIDIMYASYFDGLLPDYNVAPSGQGSSK